MVWLTGWGHRKSHTINQQVGAGTDYPVKIVVHRTAGVDAGDDVYVGTECKTDFGDIRFTENDEETLLDYFLEYEETSFNGLTKDGANPIHGPHDGYNCSVWEEGGNYYLFYQEDFAGKRAIWRSISPNGKTAWVDDGAPILTVGAGGDWDDLLLHVPTVWKEGIYYYMIYGGRHQADNKNRAFIARSTDMTTWGKWNGVDWTGPASPIISPTLGWEGNETEPWGLIKVGITYYLWYDTIAGPRRTGLATSTDLTTWAKDANNPIFSYAGNVPFEIAEDWYCASPFKYGDYYYLMICLKNGSGTIELFRDSNPTFYRSDRIHEGTIISLGAGGTWDDDTLDGPFVLTDNINKDSFDAAGGRLWMYYGAFDGAVRRLGLTDDLLSELDITHAQFWVEISDNLSLGNATIYVYYGNDVAVTTSNGDNTFSFFDDFDDLTAWTVEAGNWSAVANVLLCNAVSAQALIRTTTFTAGDYAFRCKWWFSQLSWTDASRDGLLTRYQDLSNYYAYWLISGSDTGNARASEVEKRVAGAWDPDINVNAHVFEINGRLIMEYTVFGNVQKGWYNELQKVARAWVNWANGRIGIRTFHNDIAIRDAIVRKYVEPEPAHGAWGAEENEPVVGIGVMDGFAFVQ